MSREDLRDEHVTSVMAQLADYQWGSYVTSELDKARAEGRAEASGSTYQARPIALTEEGRNPIGLELEEVFAGIREKHPLGTRIRVTVEVVHRQPGERGGIDDL